MAGAGDGMDARVTKRLQGCGSYSGDSDNNEKEKRANEVNHDPSRSIYRGVHPICPLRLLPPYATNFARRSCQIVRRTSNS
jgi:hypothetical protein